jgi:hypothetical protein
MFRRHSKKKCYNQEPNLNKHSPLSSSMLALVKRQEHSSEAYECKQYCIQT